MPNISFGPPIIDEKKYKNICFGLHGSLAGEIWQAHLTLHHHHGTRPEDTRGCHCHPECVSAVLSLYFFGLWSGISFLFNSIFTRVSEVWKYGPRFFSELDIDSRKVASRILGLYLVSHQQIYKKENSIVPSSMANFIQLESHTTWQWWIHSIYKFVQKLSLQSLGMFAFHPNIPCISQAKT